jgi:hypothetical protein
MKQRAHIVFYFELIYYSDGEDEFRRNFASICFSDNNDFLYDENTCLDLARNWHERTGDIICENDIYYYYYYHASFLNLTI